jgi:hypothetical protein
LSAFSTSRRCGPYEDNEGIKSSFFNDLMASFAVLL